ncbi:hypothetical protein TB1_003737 [Malus domestica]
MQKKDEYLSNLSKQQPNLPMEEMTSDLKVSLQFLMDEVERKLARQREEVEHQREEAALLRKEVAREREAATYDQEAIHMYIAGISQASQLLAFAFLSPSANFRRHSPNHLSTHLSSLG